MEVAACVCTIQINLKKYTTLNAALRIGVTLFI